MKIGTIPKGQRIGTIYDSLEQGLDAIRIGREVREILAQIEEYRCRYGDDTSILKIEAMIASASSELFDYTCSLGKPETK